MRDIVVLTSAKVESERNRRSSGFAHSVERVDNILEVSVSCFGRAYSAFCMDPYVCPCDIFAAIVVSMIGCKCVRLLAAVSNVLLFCGPEGRECSVS